MITDSRRYAEDVAIHGLSDTHQQVINWVPRGARVLELGCSTGYISRVLIEQKGCSVTGAEFDANAAQEARAAGLTVLQGSLEDPAFRASIEGVFDIVIAADVLEHLANPEVVLAHFRQWLAPNGRAILAVPNVACWEIRRGLFFRGEFRYQESGIMDRTHLHFFTWETFHELLTEQRYRVLETMTEMQQIPLVGPVSNRRPPTRITRLRQRRKNSKPWVRLALAPWALVSEVHAWFSTTIADAIIYKWPNLCIGHVAVLVAPRD
jgi:methionine biosynthesis protein MetW